MFYRFIIVTILYFSLGALNAQNSYERWISTPEDEYIHRMRYMYGDMFIMVGHRGEYTTNHIEKFFNYRNVIYKSDFELNLTDSLIIDQIDGHEILIQDFIKIDDQGMLFWGQALNIDIMDEQLCFMWLDENLNIVNSEILGDNDLLEVISDGIQSSNGNMLFIGSTSDQVLEGQYLLWQFDENSQEINKVIHNDFVAYDPYLVELPGSSKYHVCSRYTTLQFDADLNFETQYEFNNTINIIPDNQNMLISQNEYIKTGLFLTAPIPGFPWEMDLALTIMDENAEVIDAFTFGIPDSLESVGRMDFVSTDTIYYGGSRNLFYNPPENSWVSLFTTNLDGEELEHRFWGGDGLYTFSDVVAIPNGGFLMASSRWDFVNYPDTIQRDIILVMENYGNPITVYNELSAKTKVDIFPNPGKNVIHINCPFDEYQFILYDEMGNKLVERNLNSQISIPVHQLSSGIYFYIVRQQDRIIQSGKWIKDR